MSKWLREGRFVYELDEGGVNRWCASVQDAHTPETELVEVARLIAAAPDLLEALKALEHALLHDLNLPEPRKAALAAIAKAEGA